MIVVSRCAGSKNDDAKLDFNMFPFGEQTLSLQLQCGNDVICRELAPWVGPSGAAPSHRRRVLSIRSGASGVSGVSAASAEVSGGADASYPSTFPLVSLTKSVIVGGDGTNDVFMIAVSMERTEYTVMLYRVVLPVVVVLLLVAESAAGSSPAEAAFHWR